MRRLNRSCYSTDSNIIKWPWLAAAEQVSALQGHCNFVTVLSLFELSAGVSIVGSLAHYKASRLSSLADSVHFSTWTDRRRWFLCTQDICLSKCFFSILQYCWVSSIPAGGDFYFWTIAHGEGQAAAGQRNSPHQIGRKCASQLLDS